jgi:excisionase family DNA binding protein
VTPGTLSVEAAAGILGVSRGLAYEMARTGKLPVIRAGRRLLVLREPFERMLRGEWRPPGAPQQVGALPFRAPSEGVKPGGPRRSANGRAAS